MSQATAPSQAFLISCVRGPDLGREFAITEDPSVLGSGEGSTLMSCDPRVTEQHAVFVVERGAPMVQALSSSPVLVDGAAAFQAAIGREQQIQIGESTWALAGAERTRGFFGHMNKHVARIVDLPRVRGFSLRAFLSEVLSRHSDAEMEQFFAVGTEETTPELSEVDTSWPKPWIFARAAAFSILIYVGFVFGWNQFGNENLIPGLIMMGSLAIPASLLIFFYEINVLRNVSLYQIARLFMAGGVLSLIFTLSFFEVFDGLPTVLGAMAAGLIEEPAKALALGLVANNKKHHWTLNGLLFGAVVGGGFAIFESMGYAFRFGLFDTFRAQSFEIGVETMMDIITLRGAFTIFGSHIMWTGLIGAALWRVKGARPFVWSMVLDPRFLRVLALSVVMHMIWNAPPDLSLPLYGNQLAVGFLGWLATLGFIQSGLKEIREVQETRFGAQEA